MAPRPPYDPRRDLAPITLIGRTPNILVVTNSLPAQNLAELVAMARARPGTLTFAHIGNGTSQHIGGEMLAQMAGVEMTAVAYNDGATMIQDILTGRVNMSFQSGVVALPRLRDNAWRAIAVSSPTRMQSAPKRPTVAELGFPGFDATAKLGMLAPASMPAANIARVNRDVLAALADPEIRTRLTDLGVELAGGTAEEFRASSNAKSRAWPAFSAGRESGRNSAGVRHGRAVPDHQPHPATACVASSIGRCRDMACDACKTAPIVLSLFYHRRSSAARASRAAEIPNS